MSETWTSTLDTASAATFGTLGVPIRLETTLVEQTGQRTTRFHLAMASLDRRYDTRRIRAAFKSGRLETTDPGHPFLTGMRSLQNRRALLETLKKGDPYQLVRVPGTELWQYLPGGPGLPGTHGHLEVLETPDLRIVAALATIGLPLLAITGSEGSYNFHLPRYGHPRADSIPPMDGVHLLASWRRNMEEIPWEHPFAQAARTQHNHSRLLRAIREDTERVLLIKPRSSWRSAIINADASPAAFDQVKRHFDR